MGMVPDPSSGPRFGRFFLRLFWAVNFIGRTENTVRYIYVLQCFICLLANKNKPCTLASLRPLGRHEIRRRKAMAQAILQVVARDKEDTGDRKRALEAALSQIDRAFGKG